MAHLNSKLSRDSVQLDDSTNNDAVLAGIASHDGTYLLEMSSSFLKEYVYTFASKLSAIFRHFI